MIKPKLSADQQAAYNKQQAAFDALNKSLGFDIFSFPKGHAVKFAAAYSPDKSIDEIITAYKAAQ